MIKSEAGFEAPETFTVKRAKPKTKAERKGDCNTKKVSKYTAEELRLNPMLAFEDEEETKKAAPKKKQVGAGMNGKEMAKEVAERALKKSVTKKDMTKEFKQKSFCDSRDKIIKLS